MYASTEQNGRRYIKSRCIKFIRMNISWYKSIAFTFLLLNGVTRTHFIIIIYRRRRRRWKMMMSGSVDCRCGALRGNRKISFARFWCDSCHFRTRCSSTFSCWDWEQTANYCYYYGCMAVYMWCGSQLFAKHWLTEWRINENDELESLSFQITLCHSEWTWRAGWVCARHSRSFPPPPPSNTPASPSWSNCQLLFGYTERSTIVIVVFCVQQWTLE